MAKTGTRKPSKPDYLLEMAEAVDGLQERVGKLEALIDGRRKAQQVKQSLPLKFQQDYETHLAHYRAGRSYLVPFKEAQAAIDAGAAELDNPKV